MNEYQDMIDQAEDRDILNDIETPEYKLLEETLENLENKDYLGRFIDETDYDNFQNKCSLYEEENSK